MFINNKLITPKILKHNDIVTYSHKFEFEFQVIEDVEELNRVLKDIKVNPPILIMNGVDSITFRSVVYFAIPEENVPLTEWKKYVTFLQVVPDESQ